MDFIKEWGMIAGLGGLALGVFLLLFKEVIRKNIFSTLTKKDSFRIVLVFMILVWSISLFSIVVYAMNLSDAYQLTVLVHGEKGKDDLLLTNRGRVKLIYGDANVLETINDKGEATFKQIPPDFFDSDKTVEILFFDPEGEPYRAIRPDSLYHLTNGEYISLAVKLFGLDRLSGMVTDFETGEPIEGARISIQRIDTRTNRYGEYDLLIPPEAQRKFQTVRAFHDDYQPFELANVPIQTEKEFPIKMKRKN